EVANQDAVVAVKADPSRVVLGVRAGVAVEHRPNPLVWRVEDLVAEPRKLIELAVGLPPVDQPELHFDSIGGEELHPGPVEKPGRIVRSKRGLVAPVLELGVGEEAYVREEKAQVHVDAAHRIEVVSGVGLAEVAVDSQEIELSPVDGEVVAWDRGRARAEL